MPVKTKAVKAKEAKGKGTKPVTNTKPPTGKTSKPTAKPSTGKMSRPSTGSTTKPITGKQTKPSTGREIKSVPPKAVSKPAPAVKPVAPVAKPAAPPAAVKSAATSKAPTPVAKPVVPSASTKAAPPTKSTASIKASAPAKFAPPSIPAVSIKAGSGVNGFKSPFAPDELKKWQELLLEKRSIVSGDIQDLVKDAMEAEDGHTTPNHIAERGSDADLQDLSLGMVGEEKELIWQIDRALRKIELNKPIPFGLCEFTKQPISKNRLQLIPWTPLSIEGAAQMERDGMTIEDMLIDD